MTSEPILELEDIKKHFLIHRGIFSKPLINKAVDGVTFNIRSEEMMALVGESGCGKSTLGRLILRLIEPTSGRIWFEGKDITRMRQKNLRPIRKNMQVVFQDPFSSLNPRMKVLDIIGRGLDIHHLIDSKANKKAFIVEWLEQVGLGSEHLNRYIHEFSGGQLQRIAIARALCLNPKFIVLDEPTSALDVSIQAQICNLLNELQSSLSLTLLFISHNLAVVKYLSNRIAVMYLGKIVEMGSKDTIFSSPKHPYTEALFSASLDLRGRPKERILLPGNVGSAINLPIGCRFYPRCSRKISICEKEEPPLVSNGESEHYVACFNPL